MKFEHIRREHVLAAIQEFGSKKLKGMLEKHGNGPSTKWYICFKDRLYDQKLILRAAHAHAGGKSRLGFKARESRRYLGNLHFAVVEG